MEKQEKIYETRHGRGPKEMELERMWSTMREGVEQKKKYTVEVYRDVSRFLTEYGKLRIKLGSMS